jgi:molecular chaperone HtpG
MDRIVIPPRLAALLKDSLLDAPIRLFADRVAVILADNKLPFFPDYTDHGVDHVNRVLHSQMELVPKEVWDRSAPESDPRVLCDKDAAVIIGSTLLHDVGMHLRPAGFLDLVSDATRFKPLPWFCDPQEDHAADRPWPELWKDYELEARRFSDRALVDIIGHDGVREGWNFHTLPDSLGEWQLNHCLVIGEFIRRHHARLAHEIAIYGFPSLKSGSADDRFPVLAGAGDGLSDLADLTGLVARSHGMSLRVCKAYLDAHYKRDLRPMGSAVLSPMALLRVADYLQIDQQRAPAVLLQLRDPQSPISVREWQKHRAVRNIGDSTDPRARMVTVSKDISLTQFLQLRDLVDGLQRELDHSTAVLDEAYGARVDLGLNHLGLSIRRVHSNLTSPAFLDSLAYVPERTGISADPHLLTLLVEPLYRDEPGVGIRELMQNAVDAVRERHAWCAARGIDASALNGPAPGDDVLIEFVQRDETDSWLLRVRDKGIGMTSHTIQNYFLRAGASFRHSADWLKEFNEDDGGPRVVRSGRFGIGAFAAFLLGSRLTLATRHVGATRDGGYRLEVSVDGGLVEIVRQKNLEIGTCIEIELSSQVASRIIDGGWPGVERWFQLNESTDWFCWDWPRVKRQLIAAGQTEEAKPAWAASLGRDTVPHPWHVIHPKGFDAVYWTFSDAPRLSCNGIRIENRWSERDWFALPDTQLTAPLISIVDTRAALPLTLDRSAAQTKTLSFAADLSRDVTMSFVAHTLVAGPTVPSEGYSWGYCAARHPLASDRRGLELIEGSPPHALMPHLCVTAQGYVPFDSWLFPFLATSRCLFFGLDFSRGILRIEDPHFLRSLDCVVIRWDCHRAEVDFRTGVGEHLNDVVSSLGGRLSGQGWTAAFSEAIGTYPLEPIGARSSRKPRRRPWTPFESVRLKSTAGSGNPAWVPTGARLSDDAERLRADLQAHVEQSIAYGYFVAEAELDLTEQPPVSLIARVWNECLGPRPVPFDKAARLALIEHGRAHSELRRHIEFWEEEQRRASKTAKHKKTPKRKRKLPHQADGSQGA